MDIRSNKSLFAIFAAAAFASARDVFGGIPLQRLSNTARRRYKREYTNSNNSNAPRHHAEARARGRALAFKTKHGHFATEC